AYNPTLGRWISRDPYGTPPFEMGSTPWRRCHPDRFLSREEPEMLPEGPNLYEYVSNNPVGLLDILGLSKTQIEGCDDFPDALENKCVKQCCEDHDRCYERNDCSMYSWGFQLIPNWSRCDKCNTIA